MGAFHLESENERRTTSPWESLALYKCARSVKFKRAVQLTRRNRASLHRAKGSLRVRPVPTITKAGDPSGAHSHTFVRITQPTITCGIIIFMHPYRQFQVWDILPIHSRVTAGSPSASHEYATDASATLSHTLWTCWMSYSWEYWLSSAALSDRIACGLSLALHKGFHTNCV